MTLNVASVTASPLSALTYQDLEAWATSPPRPSEDERTDFKREFTDGITRSIAAMANEDGGIVVVGVDEEEQTGQKQISWPPIGIPVGTALDKLYSLCYANLHPFYRPEAALLPMPDSPDRGVLIIRVPAEISQRPLWHKDKGILIRIGDQNHVAPRGQIRELFFSEARNPAQEAYKAATGRLYANANGYWLGCAIKFSAPARVFDSAAKNRLARSVESQFPVSPERYSQIPGLGRMGMQYPRTATPHNPDSSSTPSTSRAMRRDFVFESSGVATFQLQGDGEEIPLGWVTQGLATFLRVVSSPEVSATFPNGGRVSLTVTLHNWPARGVVPGILFVAQRPTEPSLASFPWVYDCGEVDVSDRAAVLDFLVDVSSQLLEISGWIDFEGPLGVIRERLPYPMGPLSALT